MNFFGAPERIRTSDPRIRNPMLYPAELPGQNNVLIINEYYILNTMEKIHKHL